MMLKHIKWLLLSIFILIFFTVVALYIWLQGSLPRLDGQQSLPQLQGAVTVSRDQQGTATIDGKYANDIAQALGYVHGQERFFQMDLSRRLAAGEVSALFGSVAIDLDKRNRLHRFRHHARRLLASLPKASRHHLERYVMGVNQGLNALSDSPFEYTLLGQPPQPWLAEDSLLVIFSMYFTLQENTIEEDDHRTQLRALLQDDLFEFLTAFHSPWQATLDGQTTQPPALPHSAWPAASTENERTAVIPVDNNNVNHDFGSNNWAIGGQLTPYKSAMLANDMHLSIRVPNTWYRASLHWQEPSVVSLHGLTLPGIPGLVVGSNTYIAWGFTNSYADLTDTIYLDTTADGAHYITADGKKPFIEHKEIIQVNDQDDVELIIKSTEWGPVINPEQEQHKVIHWVAYSDAAINFELTKLATTTTVAAALKLAPTVGMPTQNLVVADAQGNIGWTLAGPLLARNAKQGLFAQQSTDLSANYGDLLGAADYPLVMNPNNQRIWTANAPVLGGTEIEKIGLGPYAHSARSQRIQQRLLDKSQFSESDLLSIQLDSDNRYLQAWNRFIQQQLITLGLYREHPISNILSNWSGHNGDAASAALTIISQEYKQALLEQTVGYLKQHDDTFYSYSLSQYRDIPWMDILSSQPANLLPTKYKSWQAFHRSVLNTAIEKIDEQALLTDNNVVSAWYASRHRHPLSGNIPLFGHLLNMPSVPLTGSKYTPNVDTGGFGASQRLVVSPGHEANAILHMPSSQSGHPLSPYYGEAHKAWATGIASPLLPGETVNQLTLTP